MLSAGRRALLLVVMCCAGAVIGVAAARANDRILAGRGMTSPEVAAVVAAALVGFAGHTLIHELGHLVAAVLVRVPVVGMRVGPLHIGDAPARPGLLGHVRVGLTDVRRGASARWALVCLAGPAVNAAVAFGTSRIAADDTHPPVVRLVAVILTAVGAFHTAGNLIPYVSASGRVNDGFNLARAVFTPSRLRDALALRRDLTELGLIPVSDGTPGAEEPATPEVLRRAVKDPRQAVALPAAWAILRTPQRSDAPLVAAFVAREDIRPSERVSVAVNYAFWLVMAHLRDPKTPEPDAHSDDLAWAARISELAIAADADALPGRTALAFARLAQDRPAEARDLLLGRADPDPKVQAWADAVRAIAEVDLGDRAQAARLVASAQYADADAWIVSAAVGYLAKATPAAGL